MGAILTALGLQHQLAAEPTDGTWSAVGTYGADVQPGSRAAVPVTVDRTMGLPAAYRAIELSAGLASSLTIGALRGGRPLNPTPALVQQPDPWRTLDSWIERQVINYATEGNNFLRVYKAANGYDTAALEVLNPWTTLVVWKKIGGRYVKRYSALTRDGRVELTDAEVIHSFGLEVAGLDRGVSPIGWTRKALGGVLDVREYADKWFRDGEGTEAVLTTEQRLDADSRRAYQQAWYEDPQAAERIGPRVRVLGSGLKYEPMMLKPADAQWLESQNAGVLDVARIFGIPAAYLEAAVDGTALTYQTLETIHAQLLRTTLFPRYLRKIEASLTRALPRGQRARFLTDELLRPDVKTRADVDKVYIDAGVYGPEYVRERDQIELPAGAPAPTPRPTPVPIGD